MALMQLASVEEAIEALIALHDHQLDLNQHLRVSFSKSTIWAPPSSQSDGRPSDWWCREASSHPSVPTNCPTSRWTAMGEPAGLVATATEVTEHIPEQRGQQSIVGNKVCWFLVFMAKICIYLFQNGYFSAGFQFPASPTVFCALFFIFSLFFLFFYDVLELQVSLNFCRIFFSSVL